MVTKCRRTAATREIRGECWNLKHWALVTVDVSVLFLDDRDINTLHLDKFQSPDMALSVTTDCIGVHPSHPWSLVSIISIIIASYLSVLSRTSSLRRANAFFFHSQFLGRLLAP
jgi:hypothetical protein